MTEKENQEVRELLIEQVRFLAKESQDVHPQYVESMTNAMAKIAETLWRCF